MVLTVLQFTLRAAIGWPSRHWKGKSFPARSRIFETERAKAAASGDSEATASAAPRALERGHVRSLFPLP
jgi:hypothetical protein